VGLSAKAATASDTVAASDGPPDASSAALGTERANSFSIS